MVQWHISILLRKGRSSWVWVRAGLRMYIVIRRVKGPGLNLGECVLLVFVKCWLLPTELTATYTMSQPFTTKWLKMHQQADLTCEVVLGVFESVVSHKWRRRDFIFVSLLDWVELPRNMRMNPWNLGWSGSTGKIIRRPKKLCISNGNEQVNLERLVTVLKLSRRHL